MSYDLRMKRISTWHRAAVLVVAILLEAGIPGAAQSNAPIRLALIGAEAEFKTAVDLLTVEFSQNDRVVLLEREELDRLYREQRISAENQDYLKLGRVSGADGIMLLTRITEGTNQFVQARLIAVKPGVVIAGTRAPWPLGDASGWAHWLAGHYERLLPKLAVPVRDAIPISVVNLRAAVRTAAAQETERQLTLLATERLTRERELFVLERRRMDLLSAEKELQDVGESAFWNGSYLLEGTIDRDGYVQETVTIDARLVAPQGVTPTTISVRGARAKSGELIEQLTSKILEALRKPTRNSVWQPEAEAAKYFDEAKWALQWGVIAEAQAAAESAWALGKQDVETATVRVKAYLPEVPPDNHGFHIRHLTTSARLLDQNLREFNAQPALARAIDVRAINDSRIIKSLLVTAGPDLQSLARARHVLRLYADFLDTLPAVEPQRGAAWYGTGIETLTAISQVLQSYNLVLPESPEVQDQLAELRSLARKVAERLECSPSVRDSYWVGDRMVSHDELAHTMTAPNIFRCKLQWGAFWQEQPEACIEIYRDLLRSPVFGYIHDAFWLRALTSPRVIGWTRLDKERAAAVWESFHAELNHSTNFLLRMEAKALEIADARDEAQLAAGFDGLFALIQSNREALVTHPVELPYLRWGLGVLVHQSGVVSPVREKMQRSETLRDLDRMKEEWWATLRQRKVSVAQAGNFEKQKAYLGAQPPYEFREFSALFRSAEQPPSKAQAQELLPLLAAYKTNLQAQVEQASGLAQSRARSGLSRIGLEEQRLQRVLNPPVTRPASGAASTTPRPAAEPSRPIPIHQPATPAVPNPTNILVVKKFVGIPQKLLNNGRPRETIQELKVINFRAGADRLWFDVRYNNSYAYYFANGMGWGSEENAISMFCDLQGDGWDLIPYPPAEGVPANRRVVESAAWLPEAIYVSGWEYVRRYDFAAKRWDKFPAPWQTPPRLFVVHDRLFGANDEALFEIRDAGRKVEILASSRRRPAATALDSVGSLRSPTVFPGPRGSIRAHAAGKIYAWNDQEWIEFFTASISEVLVAREGTLLIGARAGSPGGAWVLGHEQTNLVLALRFAERSIPGRLPQFQPMRRTEPEPSPARWEAPPAHFPNDSTVLVDGENLYHYAEYSVQTQVNGRPVIAEKEGRHADLTYLDAQTGGVTRIALKFDSTAGPAPGAALDLGGFGLMIPDKRLRLTLTRDYLCINKPGLPGVWLIPRWDLNAAIKQSRSSASARDEKQRFPSPEASRPRL